MRRGLIGRMVDREMEVGYGVVKSKEQENFEDIYVSALAPRNHCNITPGAPYPLKRCVARDEKKRLSRDRVKTALKYLSENSFPLVEQMHGLGSYQLSHMMR
jgi:hypothetical protein